MEYLTPEPTVAKTPQITENHVESKNDSFDDMQQFLSLVNSNRSSPDWEDNVYDSIPILKNLIRQDPTKAYVITFGDDHRRGFTISHSNVDSISSKIQNLLEEENFNSFGSDAIDNFRLGDFNNVDIEEITKSTSRKNRSNDGGFFAYYNLSNFDLSKYQIYKKGSRPANDDHCLFKTFQVSGLFNDFELDDLKVSLTGTNMPKRLLSELALKFNICIKLTEYCNTEKANQSSIYYIDGKTKDSFIKAESLINNRRLLSIGLFKNHYFINDVIPIHTASAKHWNELPWGKYKRDGTLYDCTRLEKNGNNWKTIKRDYNQSALAIIKTLFDNNAFAPLDDSDYFNLTSNDVKKSEYVITNPPYINQIDPTKDYNPKSDDNQDIKFKEKNWLNDFEYIIFADTETYTDLGDHKIFMISYSKAKSNCFVDKAKIKSEYLKSIKKEPVWNPEEKKFINESLTKDQEKELKGLIEAEKIKKNQIPKDRQLSKFESGNIYRQEISAAVFMEQIVESNSLIYFHNLRYDWQQFFNLFHLKIEKGIETGNQIYERTVRYDKKRNIVFRDSYKMISSPLKDFAKMFDLQCSKELFPYDFYNSENVKLHQVDPKIVQDAIRKQTAKEFKWNKHLFPTDEDYQKYEDEQVELLMTNAKESKSLSKFGKQKGQFVIDRYAKFYCDQDVRVLQEGMMKFRDQCLEFLKLDPFNYVSNASLADQWIIKEGCYEDVFLLKGVARDFVQKSIIGGLVATKDNKAWHLLKKVQDFDAVSLYPSAMYRLAKDGLGFPKGLHKIITTDDYNVIKNYNHYVVEIVVTKVNKSFDIPMLTYKLKDKRLWTNQAKDTPIVVDKLYLEDLIKHHEIEFKILRGIYWNNGFNNKISEKIEYLFNKRLEYKAVGNKLEQLCKLIMNSAYGKTLEKEHDTNIVYINGKEAFDKYIEKNYNLIKSFTELSSFGNAYKKYKVVIHESLMNHQNRAHCGGIVLSMSKRIMNEVAEAARESNAHIWYRDTDSMHIYEEDIEKISNKFKELYDRDLIGKHMGQFHSDFDSKKGKGKKEICAIETVIIQPKMYADKLLVIDEFKNEYIDWHFRMKGVSHDVVRKKAIEEFEGDVCKMYSCEKEIEFDLSEIKPKFVYNKEGGVTFKRKVGDDFVTTFIRKIKFKKVNYL